MGDVPQPFHHLTYSLRFSLSLRTQRVPILGIFMLHFIVFMEHHVHTNKYKIFYLEKLYISTKTDIKYISTCCEYKKSKYYKILRCIPFERARCALKQHESVVCWCCVIYCNRMFNWKAFVNCNLRSWQANIWLLASPRFPFVCDQQSIKKVKIGTRKSLPCAGTDTP